jgi:hypothetical protein
MNIFKRSGYQNLDNEPVSSRRSSSWCERHHLIFIILGIFVMACGVVVYGIFTIFPTPQGHQSDSDSSSSKSQLRQEAVELENDNKQEEETSSSSEPIIKTRLHIKDGWLSGKILKTRGGREYGAFYNIPYAQPPIGQLRFEPPQEYTSGWTGMDFSTKICTH